MGELMLSTIGVLAGLVALQSSSSDMQTGNGLMSICQETSYYSRGQCLGYIVGVADGLQLSREVCPQNGVTLSQVRDMVVKGLESNPASRHQSASVLIWHYLSTSFPCGR